VIASEPEKKQNVAFAPEAWMHLADDPSAPGLERPLEVRDHLGARRVVRCDRVDALREARLGEVLAHGGRDLTVGERRAPDVGRPLGAGDVLGARVRDDQQLAGLRDRIPHAERGGRVDQADDHVDAVVLQHLLHGGHAGLRGLALVGEHRLHGVVAELAGVLVQPQLPAALHVRAERRVDARLRHHEPDLDRAAAAARGVPALRAADAAAARREDRDGRGRSEQTEEPSSGEQVGVHLRQLLVELVTPGAECRRIVVERAFRCQRFG
jgi:hypothetical protein